MTITKGISVIICCYNSSQRLPRTLEHLVLQEVPAGVPWEVIIVDNCSTDGTAASAETQLERSTAINYKITWEQKPGLSFAREKGIAEASYEYVLFCDDDNWLQKDYISVAFEVMESKLTVGVLCGCATTTGQPLPVWFTTYQNDYAIGAQGLYSGDISARGFCWGAGMVFRKSVLLQLRQAGFYPMLSDRTGDTLTSGGDSEICKWFLIAGYSIWYDERLVFAHYVPEGRLKKEYLNKLRESFTSAGRVLDYYDYFIYFKNNETNPLTKGLKIPLHLTKWAVLKEQKSKLFLLTLCPLAITKKLNFTYYSIRQAAENFSTMAAPTL